MQRGSRILAALIFAGASLAAIEAGAQSYPDRPVKVIMPFPPGGVLDSLTRAVGEHVRTTLGQPWIVENRAGASGSVGLQACAQSMPDGYTLCSVTAEALSVTPHYEPKLYDRYRSLVPVSQFVTGPGVVYAHSSVAARDLKDLVALARTKVSQLNYSSWGLGTSPHIFFEWVKKINGIDIVHVPFRGSNDAVNEVISGRIHLSYIATGFILPHIKAGTVKPLASIGDVRSGLLPETPSLGELGIQFPYKGAWFGLLAPEGTPKDVLNRIAAAVKAAVNDGGLRAKFLDPQGYQPVGSTPEEFAAHVRAEYARGAEIMKFTGLTASQ